jgi:molecular chaperone DnaK (HSP70)
VPSQILYINGQTKWGFDIPADRKPLQWFKLLMLRPEDMKQPLMDDKIRDSTYIKEAREILTQLNKTAEDVVADYLRLLWQHVVRDMKKSRGEATVDSIPFRVVITFPAVWPLYAQSRLKQAATIAGIKAPRSCGETKLDLCPEPEAAALAVMDDYDGHPVDVSYLD